MRPKHDWSPVPFIPGLPDGYQWVMFLFFPPSPPHCFLLSPERRHGQCFPCVLVFVHLLYNSSWKFHQLAARQLMSGQQVRYGKGRGYGTSITYKITPARSLSSLKPDGPPCWVSPLAFALIGCHCLICPLPSLPSSLISIYYILPTLFSRI
jgi:hypothetical protein